MNFGGLGVEKESDLIIVEVFYFEMDFQLLWVFNRQILNMFLDQLGLEENDYCGNYED